jgi:hypothetical protein
MLKDTYVQTAKEVLVKAAICCRGFAKDLKVGVLS